MTLMSDAPREMDIYFNNSKEPLRRIGERVEKAILDNDNKRTAGIYCSLERLFVKTSLCKFLGILGDELFIFDFLNDKVLLEERTPIIQKDKWPKNEPDITRSVGLRLERQPLINHRRELEITQEEKEALIKMFFRPFVRLKDGQIFSIDFCEMKISIQEPSLQ